MKAVSALLSISLAFVCVSCGTAERDGRKYYGANNPVQGKMGVQFRHVKADVSPEDAATAPAPAQPDNTTLLGALGMRSSVEDQPPGLLDRNEQPDEPGANYWMHGQQSANPVMSKMGVQVSRRKKKQSGVN